MRPWSNNKNSYPGGFEVRSVRESSELRRGVRPHSCDDTNPVNLGSLLVAPAPLPAVGQPAADVLLTRCWTKVQ